MPSLRAREGFFIWLGKEDTAMGEAANSMLDAIRDIVRAELDNMDSVALCVVGEDLGEDRYSVSLASDPDARRLTVSNSTAFPFKEGDRVYVYQVRNKPEDSFIFAPCR